MVYVGLSPEIPKADAENLKDKLFIYFQKKDVNPCCEVEGVEIIADGDRTWFKIFFADQSGTLSSSIVSYLAPAVFNGILVVVICSVPDSLKGKSTRFRM